MKRRCLLYIALCGLFACSNAWPQSLDPLIEQEMGSLVATYKSLHQAPELSGHEEKTSAFVARELRLLGFEVTEQVGRYPQPGWVGYGVVGVMKNGSGPTVLVRTELDALPVTERTGLPYASKVTTRNDAGQEVGVMHACGHDLHMTSFLGTARLLSELKDRWHGTLVMIGQPAEETVAGAAAMLEDGLYTRFPKPDYAISLHDTPLLEAGRVGYTPGYALASATSVNIIIHGIGGHGSAPQVTKDPIVVAAQVVLALQTIVSREVSPFDPAVVTVGSIQGGSKNNIIPDEVRLLLTVRTYEEKVRQHILASITRITKNIALAGGIPEELAPEIRVSESTPATYNDPVLTERLSRVFEKELGAANVEKMNPIMASEDFGRLGLEGRQIPIVQFSLGAADPAKLAESRRTGKPLPGLHSSLFAPLPGPAIGAGVKATTAAVLDLMK
jgi:amidohydrolase